MDPHTFYELYRRREAELEADLAHRLALQLRPEAAVPRRGRLRAWWAARTRRGGAPAPGGR